MGKRRRVAALALGHELGANALCRRELGFGIVDAAKANAVRPAAAPGEVRQRIDRRLRAAKLIDQRPKGRRANILAAQEA